MNFTHTVEEIHVHVMVKYNTNVHICECVFATLRQNERDREVPSIAETHLAGDIAKAIKTSSNTKLYQLHEFTK